MNKGFSIKLIGIRELNIHRESEVKSGRKEEKVSSRKQENVGKLQARRSYGQ